jgi:hypothetical protein
MLADGVIVDMEGLIDEILIVGIDLFVITKKIYF